jgi:hypothetical protein
MRPLTTSLFLFVVAAAGGCAANDAPVDAAEERVTGAAPIELPSGHFAGDLDVTGSGWVSFEPNRSGPACTNRPAAIDLGSAPAARMSCTLDHHLGVISVSCAGTWAGPLSGLGSAFSLATAVTNKSGLTYWANAEIRSSGWNEGGVAVGSAHVAITAYPEGVLLVVNPTASRAQPLSVFDSCASHTTHLVGNSKTLVEAAR